MPEPENKSLPKLMTDPPLVIRKLLARRLNRVISPKQIAKARARAEQTRLREKAPHRVTYFHQTDDPYSHLALQVLGKFVARYDVELEIELIRAARGINQPRYEDLQKWAYRDAGLIAPYYGLRFPTGGSIAPDGEHVLLAERALAALPVDSFIKDAFAISEALWQGDSATLSRMAEHGVSADAARLRVDNGSMHRDEMGHYSGAMFHYGGEWYWGVDRLNFLEDRLRALGTQRDDTKAYIIDRQSENVAGIDASGLTLHYYPSLNSPYSAISYPRTLALRDACGLTLRMKPVLPMVMRGVPASMTKARYVFFDSMRESILRQVPFGPVMPPVGRPVREAYALLPWAKSLGKDEELMGALLHQAFAKAAPLHRRSGLKRTVESVGLTWRDAEQRITTDDWKEMVASYQKELVSDMGLWGVPSYRLSGPDGETDFEVWGQDRLWLVAAEIRRRTG
ncbi:MAG: 2-hydroxychromene-2-carboxylate isomerase [Rhizobiales bacterium]|nr:2-hydroxychromene-2-carboxylate isomerase [Hyphomicrobiales bacterium]